MNVIDKIKDIIKGITKGKKITNPNSERYTFIGNDEVVREQHVQEYRVWGLIADSDELNNFYLGRKMGGYAQELLYNENKRGYFWAKVKNEKDKEIIKKVHTGIAKAAITTMVNCLQDVKITSKTHQEQIDKILKKNKFSVLLNQQSRPITLALGDGAWKVGFNKDVSDVPLIQFYESSDVKYIYTSGIITGIVYKDYYQYQGKNYILFESRYVENGNSVIKYELYRLGKSNSLEPVELDTIPELSGLPKDGYTINGVKEFMGVESKFFYDPNYPERGLSVLSGKLDILDDMDMLASVESMTEELSVPVEYYPVDLLKKDKNGRAEMPKLFGRRFIKKPVLPGPDGQEDGKIDTSAPPLDFSKYSEALKEKTCLFLSGFLSPSSMGIDISKKDNAEAQREKEKVTITTRNNIKANEEEQIEKLMRICLMLQEYMDTGDITITDYDISIKYNDFASPTFETMSQILTPMLSQGAISSKMFVDKLYGDSLSEDEKAYEISEIDRKDQESTLGDMFNDEGATNMGQPDETPEQTSEFEE